MQAAGAQAICFVNTPCKERMELLAAVLNSVLCSCFGDVLIKSWLLQGVPGLCFNFKSCCRMHRAHIKFAIGDVFKHTAQWH